MRKTATAIWIAAFATIALLAAPLTAKELKGEEIAKLFIGNTVEYENPRNTSSGRPGTVHVWVYYESSKMRKGKGDFRFLMGNGDEKIIPLEYERAWRISNDGQYCSINSRDEETCRTVSVEGDTVTLSNANGSVTGKYHKGNPKGL